MDPVPVDKGHGPVRTQVELLDGKELFAAKPGGEITSKSMSTCHTLFKRLPLLYYNSLKLIH